MILKSDKEEKQAQGRHEIADDIAGENNLEDLCDEIDHGIPENGDLLVMVKALPADGVEKQACQDLRIGNGVKQGMEDPVAVQQVFVKVGDPPCGGGGKDQEGFQEMDRKEEDPDRSLNLRDLCDVIRVQHENAGQQVIKPQISQVDGIADLSF